MVDLKLIKTERDVIEALKWKTQFERDVLVITYARRSLMAKTFLTLKSCVYPLSCNEAFH